MNVHLISYDLNKPGQDYEPLFDAIKALGDHYHCLKSGWAVYNSMTAAQIWTAIRPYVDKSDYVLVTPITEDCAGQMPAAFWRWLEARQ